MCVYPLKYEFRDYLKVMGTMENGKIGRTAEP
jgi:ethanolamine ammonia-lyase large subunit